VTTEEVTMAVPAGVRWLITCVLAGALLAGCGGAPSTTDTDDEPSVATQTTEATQTTDSETTEPVTETFTEPETEDVDETEDPVGGDDEEVAVSLPGLPIGGFHQIDPEDPRVRCVVVNWSGPPDLVPPEANLEITGISVEPADAYGWAADGCDGFGPCLNAPGVLDAGGQCGVRVDQIAGVPDGRGVLSVTSGTLTCAPEATAVCEQFAAEVEASPPDDIEWDDAVIDWDSVTESPTGDDGPTDDTTDSPTGGDDSTGDTTTSTG